MKWTAIILLMCGLYLVHQPVHAHDIYTNLYSGGSPGVGQWCCSGDAVTGDCEAVGTNYRVLDDGSAVLSTKRYGGREVHVAKDKITWLPVAGGEYSEAHWCGKPRRAMAAQGTQELTYEQVDPEYWTYCAFIAPGGV